MKNYNNSPLKLAVFLSGPKRFAPLVIRQIETLAAFMVPEFFVHLWTEDGGPKARVGYNFETDDLLVNPSIKMLILQRPYDEVVYRDEPGVHTNSNSPIYATMGMFLGLNSLCHAFSLLPDNKKFTHILRIRTDCAILKPDFFSRLDYSKRCFWVARNPGITGDWISDHLCLSSRDDFMLLWKYRDMNEIYKFYKEGRRNPEKMLRVVYQNKIYEPIPLVQIFDRYTDYQIVYTSVRNSEPDWVNKAIQLSNYEIIFQSSNGPCEKSIMNLPQKSLNNPDHLAGWRYMKSYTRMKVKNALRACKLIE